MMRPWRGRGCPPRAQVEDLGRPESLRIALKNDVPPPDLLGSRCPIAQGRLVFHILGAMVEFDVTYISCVWERPCAGFPQREQWAVMQQIAVTPLRRERVPWTSDCKANMRL